MKVSFGILTHNETSNLENLLTKLTEFGNNDEIVIVDDMSTNPITEKILDNIKKEKNVHVFYNNLNKNFSAQRNFLKSKCSGDYIFNIDADEMVSDYLLEDLHEILEKQPIIEAYWMPRINIVNGITETQIKKWDWKINTSGWLNWPDNQMRIYKNLPNIKWTSKVYEHLKGYKYVSHLPHEEKFAILHKKDIGLQKDQKNFNEKLYEENK
jgi:glycosyltransferase involved in cell wall biosynthesis